MNPNFIRTGERLKLIRRELKLRIVHIEEELSFPKNTISRIENGEGGTIHSFIELVLFYYKKGYNINYIIGTSSILKIKKTKETVDVLELKNNIENIIKNLDDIKNKI
ncbi:helix-turn-helix transcriptional regulator [Flavobacterium oreochromis]|uniref:helix-turn-helix domain-containing protein n=1 Tax=Flavobacterium oreochromis TaxID=2906078 RepID=UPI00385A616C